MGDVPDSHGRRQGTSVTHSTSPMTAPGLEGFDVATFQPMSPSSSSPSMGNIATLRRSPNVITQQAKGATVSVEGIEKGGTNTSPALDYSITSTQNLDSDFQVDEGLHPTEISSAELESGWISWLMGDGFDLDAVNSSLLQATTGDFLTIDPMLEDQLATGSFNIGPQAMDEGSALGGLATRQKWHTHVEQTTSDAMSPDSSDDRNQIDETYRSELADRLQQRVQTGILPSTAFLVSSCPFIM